MKFYNREKELKNLKNIEKASKIDLHKLEQKALKLTSKYNKYSVEYRGFSLRDM